MARTDLKNLHGTLQTKIIRRVVGILVVPAFLLILVFYFGWNSVQEAGVARNISVRTAQIAQLIASELDAWAALLRSMSQDPRIRDYLDGRSAQLSVESFESLYASMQGRRLKGVLSGMGASAGAPSFSTWKVPQEYRQADRMPGWGLFDLLSRNPGKVMAYREVLSFSPEQESVFTLGIALPAAAGRQAAWLTVNLMDQGFLSLFLANGNGVSTKFFLTSAYDRVVIAQDRSWVSEFGEYRVAADEGRVDMDNSSYVYARKDIAAWGLRLVGISSDESLRESFRTGILTIIVLLLASSVVLVLILAVSIKRITRPMHEVLDTMGQVSKGNFKARMTVRSGDELEQIATRFNAIVAEMEDMVKRLMAQIELAKNAEMKQLQAQLNPHFLYNTLDAAAWMVQMGESAKGLSIIADMSRVLRYSLERRESELMVPLREDLRIMKTYLNIHQLCLGERLKVEYSIDEGALDFLIPRLLLQPVIENAVIHGIAESRGGTITISVERRESMLEIVIADTGKGFVVKREELGGLGEAAPASGGAADSSHIGLGLVLRRAALHFGERHTLDIHSEPGRGTRVTLRIRIPDGEAA